MTVTLTFLVTALLSQTLAAPSSFNIPGNTARQSAYGSYLKSCRLFTSPSKCVGGLLPIQDKEPWCHYRMCSPSYIPADNCPENLRLQATAKCIVEEVTQDVYKCDGNSYGRTYLPLGCKVGSAGCKQVATCSCVKHKGQTAKVLRHIFPFKPDCPSTNSPTTTTTTPATTTTTTTPTTTTTTTTPTTTTTTTTPTTTTTTTTPTTTTTTTTPTTTTTTTTPTTTTTTTTPTTTTTTPTTTTTTTSPTTTASTSMPDYANVDCAKCGQVLECYVKSGSPATDAAVCGVILDLSKFCTQRGGRGTTCGQQCSGSQGVKCFEGESWGTCPAVLGSKNGAAKCKGGARGGRPAALSNFASYTVTIGATPSVYCLFKKCDSGSTCLCANS